jgi:hypothetical protein
MRSMIVFIMMSCLVLTIGWAQEPEPDAGRNDDAAAGQLQVIRDDLIQLQLEKALAGLDVLMARTDLSRIDRAEGWILRGRAHVAFGDLDAAENDYREVLNLRPDFEPEGSLITPKAADRFNRLRAAMVGTLRIVIMPGGTSLYIDDEERVPTAEGTLAVLAGSHRLRIEKTGFESVLEELEVPAGVELKLERQLYPNARDVVVRTWIPGVMVFLDGEEIGHTTRERGRQDELSGSTDPVLVIPSVALGEHDFEFSMDCHHTLQIHRMVTVDILDPSPLLLPRVELEAARVRLTLDNDLAAATVFLDGETAGEASSMQFPVCPGSRSLEIRASGRVVYSELLQVQDGQAIHRTIVPRPNVILVGTDTWPAALARLEDEFSVTASSQDRNDYPPDTDLVLTVLPPEFTGGEGQLVLYSVLLDETLPLTPHDIDRLMKPRPSWVTWAPGIALATDPRDGSVRVVGVSPGGPAESAGVGLADRILSVAGQEVATVSGYQDMLDQADTTQPLQIVYAKAGDATGDPHTLELAEPSSPWLAGPVARGLIPGLMAAWAQTDAAADPKRASAALANLALVYADTGRYDAAVQTWKRVRWPSRRGIGEGTRAYYLGIVLDRLGREDEAVRAFRKASGSDATAVHDDGPAVGPAAVDHLADLGVIVDGPGS